MHLVAYLGALLGAYAGVKFFESVAVAADETGEAIDSMTKLVVVSSTAYAGFLIAKKVL